MEIQGETSHNTKKCKFCQSEIDKKARVCPVCKRPLKGHGCLTAVIIFIAIIIISIAIGVSQNGIIQRQISGTTSDSQYITMAEYNKINTGMTYEAVKKIVGSNGEVSSQSESNGYKIIIITWYGNGTAGSNANVTFTNNKVTGKAQVGLN